MIIVSDCHEKHLKKIHFPSKKTDHYKNNVYYINLQFIQKNTHKKSHNIIKT
ncbi:hypothetical protein MARBORIA2_13090 [Methanobrevibacter arboriphilus]|nr:hypothetical protein MARBORIA2_13090 [Methanobrevibacter arboriphilus]